MSEDYLQKNHCRICASERLLDILDLGEMPPANAFLRQEDLAQPELTFPLVVAFCLDCSLLQLRHTVQPELLFRDYPYATSASQPLADHFVAAGRQLAERFGLTAKDLVVEIGGNDGTLLAGIKDRCRVLNIEPASTVAALAQQGEVETLNVFFSQAVATEIKQKIGSAKLIIANNVIAHLDDLKDIFTGITTLLDQQGVFVFEVHWVGNLIGEGGFDQIYHEHLSYFSLLALQRLVAQVGLEIFDVELLPIHGQSLRVYVGNGFAVTPAVAELLAQERALGLDRSDTFLRFQEKVVAARDRLRDLLADLKREGKRIVGYGAPAKGNTLLNYAQIDTTTIDFLIDTTSFKQGRYSPGMRIPVHPPEKIRETPPDYLLLFAWNYADVIIQREAAYRAAGGKFIVPVPEPRIIE